MDEHRHGVAINGARAESRSEQGWGKDDARSSTRVRGPVDAPGNPRLHRAWPPSRCRMGYRAGARDERKGKA